MSVFAIDNAEHIFFPSLLVDFLVSVFLMPISPRSGITPGTSSGLVSWKSCKTDFGKEATIVAVVLAKPASAPCHDMVKRGCKLLMFASPNLTREGIILPSTG